VQRGGAEASGQLCDVGGVQRRARVHQLARRRRAARGAHPARACVEVKSLWWGGRREGSEAAAKEAEVRAAAAEVGSAAAAMAAVGCGAHAVVLGRGAAGRGAGGCRDLGI